MKARVTDVVMNRISQLKHRMKNVNDDMLKFFKFHLQAKFYDKNIMEKQEFTVPLGV